MKLHKNPCLLYLQGTLHRKSGLGSNYNSDEAAKETKRISQRSPVSNCGLWRKIMDVRMRTFGWRILRLLNLKPQSCLANRSSPFPLTREKVPLLPELETSCGFWNFFNIGRKKAQGSGIVRMDILCKIWKSSTRLCSLRRPRRQFLYEGNKESQGGRPWHTEW